MEISGEERRQLLQDLVQEKPTQTTPVANLEMTEACMEEEAEPLVPRKDTEAQAEPLVQKAEKEKAPCRPQALKPVEGFCIYPGRGSGCTPLAPRPSQWHP